ncbi:GMC family oxidoreductase N-terminal domain-containing protein [Brucella sp. NF 2653]|uniref:GMC family oxidoreductase N-terminal domain-containing protein n=1 Tax=Brucella sp. NF 2653 TaxID=693748 RepID=UPI00210FA822|nr:GMC family oxidoreductase N-terminal domain-containing protein [Brucella sp. 83/13]
MSGTYDYIIVGGGLAGCMVANYLSANRVLLIESSRRDRDPWIHIPATFFKALGKGINIPPIPSDPQPGLNGRPSSCELSGGCPFGADRGDWSYHTSVFQDCSE